MPQQGRTFDQFLADEEERAKRGKPLPAVAPKQTVGPRKLFDFDVFMGRRKEPGMMSAKEILTGPVAATATGALFGGPAGAAAGAAGSAISPESAPEQAAVTAASGLLPAGTGTLARMLAAGTAGSAARFARGGSPLESAVTGVTSAGGEAGARLLGLFRPGAMRQGIKETSEEVPGKLTEMLGPQAAATQKLAAEAGGGPSVEGIFKRLSQIPAIVGRKRTSFQSALPAGSQKLYVEGVAKGQDPNLTGLFSNPKRVEEITRFLNIDEQKALVSRYIERGLSGIPKIRLKPRGGPMAGGEEVLAFDAGKSYAWLRDFTEETGKEAFKSLPKEVQSQVLNFQTFLQRMADPAEAVLVRDEVSRGLIVGGAFTAGRLGAGMTRAVEGGLATLAFNLSRRFTNPEVQALIARANKGDVRAIQQLVRQFGAAAPEVALSGVRSLSGLMRRSPGQ